ncbi:glutathione S-transferase family protein [Pseudoteredinibacter isoporae]|uniref:glutathione S-transferase family protein n=1 Tax=Pseudoteredinibacter isoporae TaxID=570281 RepID=UPI00310BC7F0
MSLSKPIPLIGAVGSPYTRKMLSLLRYRRIPHYILWDDPSLVLDEMGIEKPKIPFLPTFIFENAKGQAEAVCDSTPIIHRLEQLQTERSVIPDDPALAFINYLLEDFGDEWCTKFMFHYRWHFSEDADNAGTELPLCRDVTLPDAALLDFKRFFSERQIGRLGYVGSNDSTAPIIDRCYRRFLSLLEAHFKTLPFLLGHRPGSGDFAIFGQLTQLVGFDPTPRAIAHEVSPRTVAWVGTMEDRAGLDLEKNPWTELESLPNTTYEILKEIGQSYVPALLANAQALMAGEKEWATDIDGQLWSQRSFPYQGKCLQWINEEYRQLSAHDQQRVSSWMAGTGCEALLMPTA